jgi:hypothetical protein
LRQGHFFSIRAHVLCHPLTILNVHARQVWKKKAPADIDVTTIAFNTRQPPLTFAKSGLLFPKCHRNISGRNGETGGTIDAGKMNSVNPTAGAKRGANFQKVNL